MKRPIIFSATANVNLTKLIATNLNVLQGDIYHHQFASNEWWCQLKENVRGADVFLIQSIVYPANDNLMQLLIMADAARRASASSITAIVPYMGYCRQDRKDKSRVPISAKLVMDIMQASGIDRIITMDLHAPQIAGFTNLPFDHLYFQPSLINAVKQQNIDVIVAPDIGAVKKAEEYAHKMGIDIAFISKKRKNDTQVEPTQFVGDVKNKNILIVDDIAESCGTLTSAAAVCKQNGANKIYCGVTHNCMSELGIARMHEAISSGLITAFYCSNTTENKTTNINTVVVDVSPTFSNAIRGIMNNESISALFA